MRLLSLSDQEFQRIEDVCPSSRARCGASASSAGR
jgi:hypothetical protein